MAPRRQPAATLALLLSLLASVDRCNAECSRPATTPAGYDLSGVVETTLTQGATFDVTGVVCDSSGGFVASGAGPAASTCTTDATSYILSGCAATAAATCGEFAYSCSELSSAALWGAELEAQVARIGLAALVGAIIGLQREFGYAFKVLCSPGGSSGDKQLNQRLKGAAGLRTHMLASIAACIFTIVSQHGFTKTVPYSAGAGSGDPARIAAQIVSGVGFLGAGTIIKGSDGQLSGLTTATTIWTSAALGICAGSDSLDDRLCLIAVAIVVACLQVRHAGCSLLSAIIIVACALLSQSISNLLLHVVRILMIDCASTIYDTIVCDCARGLGPCSHRCQRGDERLCKLHLQAQAGGSGGKDPGGDRQNHGWGG
jgi:uncharacterized membrane protein YhiD involved in acid resistance